MGLPSIIASIRKAARELFSGTDKSDCQFFFTSLANGRGESPCLILATKERCETLYSTVYRGNSDCNCDRAFSELARACLTCRSKFAPALACTASNYTPPYEPANIHMFREVMETADIPKWSIRGTDDNLDPTSAPQSSRGWTAAQILTPILVGIILCLAFALWFLYYTGRLSRLTYILYSMRRSRPQRHRWTIDNDDPSGGALHHGPDAEALPMINPVLHWRSLSLNDDATNHKRYNARMGMGALTPVLSKGISSIRRLFGRGPVKVSRAPVSDTFDLEDPVSEADPFDTHGSSTSSRSWRNGPPIVERNSGSTLDRIPSPHDLINKLSWSSTAPESVPDNGQENYENTGNVSESGGGETDHDHEVDAGNGVMLISRDGENFSLSGSMISVPIGSSRRSVEVDRGSIEVVPPSPPAVSSKQPFRHPSIARSASTPHLCPPSSEKSHIRPFRLSPSTDDLSNVGLQPIPKSSFLSPTHFSTRPAAASSGVQPSRKDAPGTGVHLFTTAAPPIDHHESVGSSPYGSSNMASTRALPPNTYSRLGPTGYSPSASPDLQTYIPSPPGSAHYLPPSPVPVSRRIDASDPQNLIPPAVRGAGYNPYQHARSVGAFE